MGRFKQCQQSEQDLCSFLSRLKEDQSLQQKVSTANNEDHVIAIALAEGFVLDKEKFWLYESKDFKRYVERRGFYSKH
ncbi:nif11-like leader peptide domain protein [Synechococcus sp. BIOS-U3-1]|uniref:Nif11-like leader peptide family natural product precursor n=1 Tax=Synechococcus sp. BIOS-U3-1 TaxID=1400865 RepID=UPI0016474FFF|nr:Nif11-like leader peptide family natural product precursor [Synechococcus sp. BIOS-U3-1]QNI59781.1 nif11-like leader peptide domain protein [Synechococcus sp. BIOS-U3-1]|tara:strand:+ start:6863 stop:7096 length:234 start_codon:yes stop_codon:yes gene_type:complete